MVAMSLSDRILMAQQAAAERGETPAAWLQTSTQGAAVDGLGGFKAQVHDALFDRLGTRLFEATNEDQMQALVLNEIRELMEASGSDSALTPQERQMLAQEIARDVMGLGPIEQFLNDRTVTEIMV